MREFSLFVLAIHKQLSRSPSVDLILTWNYQHAFDITVLMIHCKITVTWISYDLTDKLTLSSSNERQTAIYCMNCLCAASPRANIKLIWYIPIFQTVLSYVKSPCGALYYILTMKFVNSFRVILAFNNVRLYHEKMNFSLYWRSDTFPTQTSLASCQINLQVVHAPRMAGTFSPSLLVSDPDMHVGHARAVMHAGIAN